MKELFLITTGMLVLTVGVVPWALSYNRWQANSQRWVSEFHLQALELQRPWVKVAPPGSHFTVMMPAAPRGEVKTNDTPMGLATTNLYIYQTEHGWYGATWTVYPPKMKIDINVELNATRDNFVKAVNGTLLEENSVFASGTVGKQFIAESPNATLTSRIFVMGNSTYQIAVAFPKNEDHKKDVERFLSSFALVK